MIRAPCLVPRKEAGWRPTRAPDKPLVDPTAIAERAFRNRANDKRRGCCVLVPVRYADDFIILVSSADGSAEEARKIPEQEKSQLAEWLRCRMGLTLSPEKTLVTPMTGTMRFLGHHLRVRKHPRKRTLVPRLVIPKDRSQRLRRTIKQIFNHRTTSKRLGQQLERLNPVLRGWGNFYRHA
jgi:hypothetical protein